MAKDGKNLDSKVVPVVPSIANSATLTPAQHLALHERIIAAEAVGIGNIIQNGDRTPMPTSAQSRAALLGRIT